MKPSMRASGWVVFVFVFVFAFAFSVFMLARRASAQPADLLLLRPSAAASSAITIESPVPAQATRLDLGLAIDHARGLLERVVPCRTSATVVDSSCLTGDADGRTRVVTDLSRVELLAALALRDYVTVGVGLPLVVTRRADDLAQPRRLQHRFGLGDLRLSLTAPLVRGRVPFALAFESTFPTGTDATLAGVQGVSVQPALVVAHALSAVTLSAKAGYRLMRRSEVLGFEQDDAVVLGVGAAWEVAADYRVLAEWRAQLGVGGRRFTAEEAPAEIDLALAFPLVAGLRSLAGVGVGAWPGEQGIGAPALRLFVAVSGSAVREHAPCSACGPTDSDADTVPDDRDACALDAEDRDGFADDDGCPDIDNDADGLRDPRDLCPMHSEDSDGYQDDDGCPEPDNDGDGIADGFDQCRADPEDRDGYQDDDGCPEPGPGKPTITVEGARILVSDRIYFDDGGDAIRKVSLPVLDELATVLVALTPHKRVRIEGHTDDVGSPQGNTDLSYRRARAVVEYLVERGVPATRLQYVGRGATMPLAPNDTPEGRALNRRVELRLLDPTP